MLTPAARTYLGNETNPSSPIRVLVPYSMATPFKMNTGRFLMYPFSESDIPTLPGKAVIGSNFVLAEILFIVDPDALTNKNGNITVYRGGTVEEDYWTTELAEEWWNPALARRCLAILKMGGPRPI